MPTVTLSPDRQSSRDIDKALRTLKKIMENENIFRILHDREYYVSPGQKRNRKLAAARLRQQRDNIKNKLPTRRNGR